MTHSTQKIEKMGISEANTVLEQNRDVPITGFPICLKCMCSFTRTRKGWFCGVCGEPEKPHQTHWYNLNEEERKKVAQNDKWFDFMKMRNK